MPDKSESVFRERSFENGDMMPALGQHSEGDVEREALNYMREIAQDMGYPSVLEALEALSEYREEVPSDRCRELEEALERVRNGLRARQPNSNVMSPVSNERLLEIINAALLSKQEAK